MDKKSLSEADIGTKSIMPMIVSACWDLKNQIRQEVYFTNGRIMVSGDYDSWKPTMFMLDDLEIRVLLLT